jgi:uncharacterized repeat protein (TIGR01451 family)
MKRFLIFLFMVTLVSIVASQDVLGPGVTKTYTANYTVKDSDICKGAVVNIANVTASNETCGKSVEDNDTASVRIVYNAAIDFEKSSDKSGEIVDAGDIITYYYYVTNTGDVPFSSVTVTDDMAGLSEIDGPDEGEGGNGDTLLDPGEAWTYTSTYQVQEEDLCHKIVNWGTVTAIDPCQNEIIKKDPEEVETTCIECCQDRYNVEGIGAGNQMAIGFHNGEAENNVKIITNQGGDD